MDSTIHPLDSIASKFDTAKKDPTSKDVMTDTNPSNQMPGSPNGVPALSPKSIQAPVILLDHELRIVWQNNAAISQIWLSHDPSSKDISPETTVFDLLFDSLYQRKVDNWRQWMAFFVRQAKTLSSSDKLDQLIAQRQGEQAAILQALVSDIGPSPERSASSSRLRQIQVDGLSSTFWVVTTDFEEGRLLVFETSSNEATDLTMVKAVDLEQRMEMVRQHLHPARMPIYVLAARLNNAVTLRTEMLAEGYCRLIDRLWRMAIETIEQYNGIISQYIGDSIFGLFLPVSDKEDNPLHVIQCALEIKSRMVELGREWKIRKGWLHDIELNMGINAGDELLGMARSSLSDNLIPLGDTLHLASCLSDLATNGQIWTTKELINKLPVKELHKLRFGIFRNDANRQVFVANCFSRIRDLADVTELPQGISADNGALAVTQIFDRQGQG